MSPSGSRPSLRDALLRDPARRRRLGTALATFTVAVTLLVTLYPFRFHFSTSMLSRIDWRLYYPGHSDRDLLQNLLMLAPLGVGIALVRHGRASIRRIALEAGAIGTGLALCVETLQIFDRSRFAQAADVWRNGVGCIVGAVLAALVLRAIDRPRTEAT